MITRVEKDLGLKSYDDYINYCKAMNKTYLDGLRNEKRFYYIQYVRCPPALAGTIDTLIEKDSYGKTSPEGVMIAVEDNHGRLVFGWSARHTLRERRPFNKAVALHKAMNKITLANSNGVGIDQTRLPAKLVPSLARFMMTASTEMEEMKKKRALNYEESGTLPM